MAHKTDYTWKDVGDIAKPDGGGTKDGEGGASGFENLGGDKSPLKQFDYKPFPSSFYFRASA